MTSEKSIRGDWLRLNRGQLGWQRYFSPKQSSSASKIAPRRVPSENRSDIWSGWCTSPRTWRELSSAWEDGLDSCQTDQVYNRDS